MEIRIPTPKTFNFQRTVVSHGWCELLPFEINQERWQLTRVIELGNRTPISVLITGTRRFVRIQTSTDLTNNAAAAVASQVRHILRLDDDLISFYKATNLQPDFEWIAPEGAGRLLRSPTVFEDLVKMICTTNCSWALTRIMVTGLVQNLGRKTKDGRKTFPTPEVMARMPVKFYSDEVRAGYRAAYLKELADRVASKSLDVEGWLNSPLTTTELLKTMKDVKGVGNYAAENLLKLVGRYDGLALDSWTRAQFYKKRNNGRKASDKKIERYYSRFKEWRGLAIWCDVTRDWIE